nr:aminotransferase class V-fold PLP-dependent enzyme [Coleofasciculus sp. FACHB-1120]
MFTPTFRTLNCHMSSNSLEAIAFIAQRYSIPFLCDASQAVGKIPILFEEWEITYLAICAHKLYGSNRS